MQGIWPLWILFAVFSYTSHWSLGVRRVFITNECLMSALESFLSGLEFLAAVEKGPVEHYLGPENSSCILFLLLARASLSYWLAAHLAELTPNILFDLLRFQLAPGTGVH